MGISDLQKHIEQFGDMPMEDGPIETLGGAKPISDMDMAELWDWLRVHEDFVLPYHNVRDFWHSLDQCLCIEYVKINPETDSVDPVPTKNTQVDVWLEFGPLYVTKDHIEPAPTHDILLNCGGPTFEVAFRKLCGLVQYYYGDYERVPYSE